MGPRGFNGSRGATGPQGPAGPAGATGPAGAGGGVTLALEYKYLNQSISTQQPLDIQFDDNLLTSALYVWVPYLDQKGFTNTLLLTYFTNRTNTLTICSKVSSGCAWFSLSTYTHWGRTKPLTITGAPFDVMYLGGATSLPNGTVFIEFSYTTTPDVDAPTQSNTFSSGITVSGTILPTTDGAANLGSPIKTFGTGYIGFLSANTASVTSLSANGITSGTFVADTSGTVGTEAVKFYNGDTAAYDVALRSKRIAITDSQVKAMTGHATTDVMLVPNAESNFFVAGADILLIDAKLASTYNGATATGQPDMQIFLNCTTGRFPVIPQGQFTYAYWTNSTYGGRWATARPNPGPIPGKGNLDGCDLTLGPAKPTVMGGAAASQPTALVVVVNYELVATFL